MLIFLFVLLDGFSVNATTNGKTDASTTDSLLHVVMVGSAGDSLLMDANFRIGRHYRLSKPSKALRYTQKALLLSKELDYELITAQALAETAYLKWRLSRFDEALHILADAAELFLKHNDLSGHARVLNTRGAIFSEKGIYDKALEDFFSALNDLKKIDSVARTGAILNNIAMVYQNQGDYELAETYHLRSLAVKEEYDDLSGIAFSINNLGVINQKNGDYNKAYEYFRESLSIRQRIGDYRGIAAVNRNIGSLYYELQQFENALMHFQVARDIYESTEDLSGIVQADYFLGKVYLATGELMQAQQYFEQSLTLAEEIGLAALIIDNYFALGELMAAKGQFVEAFRFQEKINVFRDSLFDAETNRRIIEIQMMHEWELRNNEMELLQQEKQIGELNLEKQRLFRNLLLIIILFILISFLLIYNRFLVHKKTNVILRKQKDEILENNKVLKDLNSSMVQQKEKVDELNKKLLRSERSLKELNKTREKFFSIISHDLRSPFASIVSFSRIMKRDIHSLSKEELQDLVVELDRSVSKINSLLDNLLQWSQSQTGKISFEPRQFRLKELIGDNLNLYASNANEKGIRLIDNVDDDLDVWGDVNMIDTILRNLISNALKYTDRGGTVTVESKVRPKVAEISVSDTGVGISEEDQKKLFRADTLHSSFGTRDEKGSGLGLLLCQEFVKKHGGQISLQSKEGEGSVFSFTLPINNPSK